MTVPIYSQPKKGWKFTHWTGLPANLISGTTKYTTHVHFWPSKSLVAEAHFVEDPDYTLKLLDAEGCKGWVEINENTGSGAKKYYKGGEKVTLKAVSSSDCCCYFEHWQGEGVTTSGHPFKEPIKNNWNKSITVEFGTNKATQNKSLELTPVFYDGSQQSPEGGTVYYARTTWDEYGKGGDVFANTISTSSDPFIWSWYGVKIRERICFIGTSIGYIKDLEEELESTGHADNAEFELRGGEMILRQGPDPAVCPPHTLPETAFQRWLVGTSYGNPDEHSMQTKRREIENHFDSSTDPITIDIVQTYYISDKGSNIFFYPKRHIARFPIRFTLYKIETVDTCYTATPGAFAHVVVTKGGVSHPCAGTSEGEFWKGFYPDPRNACECTNGYCGNFPLQ